MAPARTQQVSSKEFAAKYKSKREVYNFLAVDAGIYLPAYEQVTIYFLKDIVAMRKKAVKARAVRHISVPQYEGLALKDIAQFLDAGHRQVYDFFPDQQEIHKVSKEWICNVCATVLGDAFSAWVKEQIEERNVQVTKKKNLMIAMDPELAAAFQASTKVSRKYLLSMAILTPLFADSEQGRLREPDAVRQQAAPHQEADRGGQAGRVPEGGRVGKCHGRARQPPSSSPNPRGAGGDRQDCCVLYVADDQRRPRRAGLGGLGRHQGRQWLAAALHGWLV